MSYQDRIEDAKRNFPSLPNFDDWIVSTPDTCSGEPRLKRTRLRVSDIVDIVKANDEATIYQDYPYITKGAVDACILYQERRNSCSKLFVDKNGRISEFISEAVDRVGRFHELDQRVLDICINFLLQHSDVINRTTTIAMVENVISLGFPINNIYVDFYLDDNLQVMTEIAHFSWRELDGEQIETILTLDEFIDIIQ